MRPKKKVRWRLRPEESPCPVHSLCVPGDVIVPEGPLRFGPDGHVDPDAIVRVGEQRSPCLDLDCENRAELRSAGRARAPFPTRTGEIASLGNTFDTTCRAGQA